MSFQEVGDVTLKQPLNTPVNEIAALGSSESSPKRFIPRSTEIYGSKTASSAVLYVDETPLFTIS